MGKNSWICGRTLKSLRSKCLCFLFSITVIIICVYKNHQANVTERKVLSDSIVRNHQPIKHDTKDDTVFTEIKPHLVYLYSAVAVIYTTTIDLSYYHKIRPDYPKPVYETRISDNQNYSSIVLIGWEHVSLKMAVYQCCITLVNGTVTKERQHIKIQKEQYLNTTEPGFVATEFVFILSYDYNLVKNVSLTLYHEQCPTLSVFYLKPNFPEITHRPGLAICNKVAFNKLDPSFLVEWFEIQRFLGVVKVLAYTYELDQTSLKVLNYYKSISLLEIKQFNVPDIERVPRQGGEAGEHWYNDETVASFDCIEHLYNYQYVVILDKDEFIVPNKKNLQDSLPRFLDSLWKANPKLGSIKFKTQIHNITGGHIDSERMMTSDCLHCSRPILDRTKNVFMPRRVVPGSITTHMLVPRMGYQWHTVHHKLATLHHYRRSRENYTNRMITINYPVMCDVMKRLSGHVTNSTMIIRKQLGLISYTNN